MDRATILIKDAMAIRRLHLHRLPGQTPKFFFNFFLRHVQRCNHSRLVVGIERNRGFAMTTVTASCAVEYLGD
jgi:hypothetical protein